MPDAKGGRSPGKDFQIIGHRFFDRHFAPADRDLAVLGRIYRSAPSPNGAMPSARPSHNVFSTRNTYIPNRIRDSETLRPSGSRPGQEQDFVIDSRVRQMHSAKGSASRPDRSRRLCLSEKYVSKKTAEPSDQEPGLLFSRKMQSAKYCTIRSLPRAEAHSLRSRRPPQATPRNAPPAKQESVA